MIPAVMALTAAEWEKLNGNLLRLYRELEFERQARVMLEVLNELVPSDSSALNILTPPTNLRVITLPEGVATPEQVEAVGHYGGSQSPYPSYYLATQDATWKMLEDFMPLEEFYRLDLYRVGLKPLGINYQTGAILAMMHGAGYVLTLHRTQRPFSEHDREVLNALHPHLVTSFVNALAHSRGRESLAQVKAIVEAAPGAYGYFNAAGEVEWIQPKAQAWLNEFFREEPKNASGLPLSLQDLVDSSRRDSGSPRQLGKENATERLTVCLGKSAVGGWVLRLDRTPNTPTAHFRPIPRLTDRANEVLQWMVEGKRNSEIATILDLSVRTVEKHVEQILMVLGVENRASAIIQAMNLAATQMKAAPMSSDSN